MLQRGARDPAETSLRFICILSLTAGVSTGAAGCTGVAAQLHEIGVFNNSERECLNAGAGRGGESTPGRVNIVMRKAMCIYTYIYIYIYIYTLQKENCYPGETHRAISSPPPPSLSRSSRGPSRDKRGC